MRAADLAENRTISSRAGWIQPGVEQSGLTLFLKTLRERRWMILASVLIFTAAAVAYSLTAEKVYKAESSVLVTPVPLDNPSLANLGLITESSDPTLSVLTAAQLITTNEVAERVRENLGLKESATSLLEDVTAEPVGQSNVVAVIAERPSAADAQEIATGFGEAVTEERNDQLRQRTDETLEQLNERLDGSNDLDAETISAEIAELETLRASGDPTVRLEAPADLPRSPDWPRPTLTIVLGVFAGLVIGIASAFALQALDPRLRREQQLRALYRLPILSRIPVEKSKSKTPLTWSGLSPPAVEAYRTLRATLTTARHDEAKPTSILVTGSSPSEGKTTTAVALAISLAVSGARVILIEADLRRPTIGAALGVEAISGVTTVLLGRSSLEGALVTTEEYGSNLKLLLADEAGPESVELFSLPSGERLVDQAQQLADYVIVDSPPLTDVIDALPLARRVDEVLVVVRLGKSRLAKIKRLGELLAENHIRPAGIAVVGVKRETGEAAGYYYYRQAADPSKMPSATAPPPAAPAPSNQGGGSRPVVPPPHPAPPSPPPARPVGLPPRGGN
jgi:capsular exopolysaccharide synthesis family protein